MAATATAQRATNISIFAAIAAPFIAIGNGLVTLAENSDRMKKVAKLNAMSDEELAKRGLSREDVVRHVFADVMGM